MAVTVSNYDPLLKEVFSPDYRDELVFNNENKFIAQLPKSSKTGRGKKFIQPVRYAQAAGTHNVFANAKANFTYSENAVFEVPRAKYYRVPKIDNEVIEASETDEAAFKPAIEEIEYSMRGAGDYLEQRMFRSSVGAIGTIKTGTTLGSTLCLLTDGSDAHNFIKGMKCQIAYNNSGTPTLRAATELTVASVNITAKTVTFTGNISGVSGAAVGDWIITSGDLGLAPYGLEDWLLADRTYISTSFCGVNRSSDPDRLAGLYYDGSTQPLNEALQDGLARLVNMGAKGTLDCWINPIVMSSLFKLLESKATITETERNIKPGIGFNSFNVRLGAANLRVMPSRNVQESRIWLLSPDTWRLNSAGEYLSFLLKRGHSIIQPMEDEDAWQCKIGGYVNLSCSAPGLNLCLKVA